MFLLIFLSPSHTLSVSFSSSSSICYTTAVTSLGPQEDREGWGAQQPTADESRHAVHHRPHSVRQPAAQAAAAGPREPRRAGGRQ